MRNLPIRSRSSRGTRPATAPACANHSIDRSVLPSRRLLRAGPITITSGGTYVGHWVSSSSTPRRYDPDGTTRDHRKFHHREHGRGSPCLAIGHRRPGYDPANRVQRDRRRLRACDRPAPALIRPSKVRLLTLCRSTRRQKSKKDVNGPTSLRLAMMDSTAPSPTFLIAAMPNRMAPPTTAKCF